MIGINLKSKQNKDLTEKDVQAFNRLGFEVVLKGGQVVSWKMKEVI